MPSQNLLVCLEKLKIIAQIKNSNLRKKVLIELFDDCLYKALNEIAINTVGQKVPLSNKLKKNLRKYKVQIKKLSCTTNNKKLQKKLVTQSGGFLPGLIPAVLTALSSLVPLLTK